MRARKIENISQVPVPLRLKNGLVVTLPFGSTLENVDITNEAEIKGKVAITRDLTEVNEESGRTRLDS